ncbi:MAG TPA: hypothetical protein VLU95_06575 [Candidatus Acidoferrum sp.]|nr:hypothetical protein [Candidatus Acidoferrum sp.]
MTSNSEDFYFDQATGMMTQWREETIQSGSVQTNSTQVMKITSSSVWVIPEFPPSTIALGFIIVASGSTLAVSKIGKFKRGYSKIRFVI